jgi:hypothetical protein
MSLLKLFLKEMSMTAVSADGGEAFNEPMYLKNEAKKKKKRKKSKSKTPATVRFGFYGMLGRDYKPVQVPQDDEKDDDIESTSGGDGGSTDGGGGGE